MTIRASYIFCAAALSLTLAHGATAYAQDSGTSNKADEGWEDYKSPATDPKDDARFKDDNQVEWFRLQTEQPQYGYEDHALSREKALHDGNEARRDPMSSIPTDGTSD